MEYGACDTFYVLLAKLPPYFTAPTISNILSLESLCPKSYYNSTVLHQLISEFHFEL